MAESSDFRTLKILDRFRSVIARTGADYDVLRLILRVKFQMDQRRVPTVLSARNGNKAQKEGNLYLRSLWLYALMGLIMVPFIVWDTGHFMLQMGLVTAMLMFMIMTSMISDFSSVLLDIRDRNIIMTKPVNGRTVGMARAIHAGVYLLLLTGSLTAAPLVAGLITHGIGFFLLFLVELILINMLILVTTSLIYLFMMKFLDGEKLEDMINMVQILLSIGIAAGYQLVIRSFSIIDFNMVFTPAWWQLLLPRYGMRQHLSCCSAPGRCLAVYILGACCDRSDGKFVGVREADAFLRIVFGENGPCRSGLWTKTWGLGSHHGEGILPFQRGASVLSFICQYDAK